MKHYSPSPDTLALFETAGDWLARREDGAWSHADEMAFQAWLASDTAHAQAFARVSRTWDTAAQLRPASTLHTNPAKSRDASTWWQRLVVPGGTRTFAGAALAACMLMIAGGAYWYGNHPTYVQTIETASSRPDKLALPDGSTVTVNRATQLAVTYYPWRREVHLAHGEAFFEVASTGQSFTVTTGNSEVRVVGTAFNVDATDNKLVVAVEHGKVAVKPDRNSDAVVMLGASDGVTVDKHTREILQATLPQQGIGSWRNGRLVFRNVMLSEVASQLSRYRDQPVEVADRVLAHRKISGVVNTTDPDAFIDSLAQLVHARISHQDDGRVIIDRR